MHEARFGFWPRTWRIEQSDLSISPLEGLSEILGRIESHPRVANGWAHPPLVEASSKDTTSTLVPANAFSLPATHRIDATAFWHDASYVHFVIAFVGLLEGMRLVPSGWSHFYKATIVPNKLTDIVCDARELNEAIKGSTKWWEASLPKCRQRMFGAIHWFCFAGSYEHVFEQFAALYTVLDTLYWIHQRQSGQTARRHAERLVAIAEAYGMTVPAWAEERNGSSQLSALRNEFVHEAQFGGEPIGFAIPESIGTIKLQLNALLSRMIVALLNIDCGYVRSPVTTRQMHGLDLA